MTLFSQRNNLKPIRVEIQLNDLDYKTRTALWNTIYESFIEITLVRDKYNEGQMARYIWANYFNNPINQMYDYSTQLIRDIQESFQSGNWYTIFDFIELIIALDLDFVDDIIEKINDVLIRELSGYRIVNYQFTKITDENEIKTIENAINNSLDGTRLHLNRALELLSDRKNPDYRNSIKESISAVEALCVEITGDPKATLGQALKNSKLKEEFHGGILNGFSNLYGFTSNAEGIRHALMDEPTLKQEDALYMLVSCSAFVNYLRSKMNK